MSARDIVMEALTALFVNFDPEAAAQYLAPDYIQHNPGVPTGAAPVLAFLPQLKEMGLRADVHRVLTDGDLVALHSTYHNAQAFGAETLVAFDIFRVENGLIVEHWDNLQPYVPAAETANGNSMVDGATEITDREKIAENKALVEALIRDVLMGAAPEKITDYISAETYIQHNPQIPNGLDGVIGAFQALAEAGQSFVYTDLHLVVAEGNFVLTASEGLWNEVPMAFYDLFRVEDGLIVEHWDVIQEILAEMAHENGKF